jgi:hypothetical protein
MVGLEALQIHILTNLAIVLYLLVGLSYKTTLLLPVNPIMVFQAQAQGLLREELVEMPVL